MRDERCRKRLSQIESNPVGGARHDRLRSIDQWQALAAALKRAGWRLILSPYSHGKPYGRYALDNGAWSAFTSQRPFDTRAFLRLLDTYAAGADWVVLPDSVAGGQRSLLFSLEWLPKLRGACPLLLAVQDGMSTEDVRPFVGPGLGIFIGGSTAWKEATAEQWGALAKKVGAYLHRGRVNTQRRIKLAKVAGCDSFDGSSVSRYVVTLPGLDGARRQEVCRGVRHGRSVEPPGG